MLNMKGTFSTCLLCRGAHPQILGVVVWQWSSPPSPAAPPVQFHRKTFLGLQFSAALPVHLLMCSYPPSSWGAMWHICCPCGVPSHPATCFTNEGVHQQPCIVDDLPLAVQNLHCSVLPPVWGGSSFRELWGDFLQGCLWNWFSSQKCSTVSHQKEAGWFCSLTTYTVQSTLLVLSHSAALSALLRASIVSAHK